MLKHEYPVHEQHGVRYVDEGPRGDLPPVVLLHGMLGSLDNWTDAVGALADHRYRVIVPVLPVYDMPLRQTGVPGLSRFVHEFLLSLELESVALVGNSLGGQVALLYALEHPERMAALILSGSSGLYEVEMGTSTPRRQDRDYIRERTALTFYSPEHATDELVEEIYDIINDRGRATRLIKMARSTRQESVAPRLDEIEAPTLLIWGRNDLITPPEVAREFKDRIPHAELHFIDRCGHAPMIEAPERFNRIMLAFLREKIGTGTLVM